MHASRPIIASYCYPSCMHQESTKSLLLECIGTAELIASFMVDDVWLSAKKTCTQNIPLYTCVPRLYSFPKTSVSYACTCTYNQAHTCKTLGVVTKPKSIASTHAQMHPRNIIHERVKLTQLISYSRPRPAPKDAGRGRKYENMNGV